MNQRNKNQLSNKSGFSLLELIIVCAIIGIMTAAALVYLGGSARYGKEVEAAAREVASTIRGAQNDALSGKNASASCRNYYFYYSNPDNKGYKTDNGSGCSNPAVQYSLGNGVTFSSVSGYFYFTVPRGEIFKSGGRLAEGENITVAVAKNSQTYNICVYPSGKVEEKKEGC